MLKYLFTPLLFFLACSKQANIEKNFNQKEKSIINSMDNKITIKQGVWGYVSLKKGNFMPRINEERNINLKIPKEKFIQREILIYEVVKQNNSSAQENGFVQNPSSKLIKKTSSDDSGFYQIELKEGKYSIFVKEEGKLYNNSFSMMEGSTDFIHGFIEIKKGVNA